MNTRSALRTLRPRTLPRMMLAAARVWLIVLRIRVTRRFTHDRSTAMSTATLIHDEVLRWPGVTEAPHRFGGVEFRLGKRELGHLHGDYLADLPFPVRVREELVREGKAMPHHILPQSGWVSYPIRDEPAVPGAIALFRLAYDRAVASQKNGSQTTGEIQHRGHEEH
jgi:hypothetical protein